MTKTGTTALAPDVERRAALFDAIGEQYDTLFPEKSGQIEATHWLIEQLGPGARVLDAGCGTGVPTARALADAGFHVLGIDISQEMLRIARANVPGAQLERWHMGEIDLPAASLDAVVAFFSLLMLPRAQIEVTLRLFARLLCPGGYLAIAMVEGDLDDVAVPFHGHTAYLTAYPQADFEAVLAGAGFEVLRTHAVQFTPRAADIPPERQLFFYCRKR